MVRPHLRTFIVSLCMLLALAATGARPAHAEPEHNLDVANYNIQHGRGMDDVIDLTRIADVLKSLEVQLVGLQEVDYFNNRNNVDQAAEIAEHMGETWQAHFYRSIDFNGGEYGNAILYDNEQLTSVDDRHIALPGAENRSAAIMLFEHADGKQFQFVTTHLTSRADEEDLRQESVASIYDALFEDVPAIFAGDFNAEPDAPVVQDFLDQGWLVTTPMDEPTFPADEPTRTIDYMALLDDGAFDLIEGQTVKNDLTQVASDHLPQVTRVHVVPEPSSALLLGAGGFLLMRRPSVPRAAS